MVAIDTNVLVRYITNDHPILSPKAQTILEAAKPNSLLLDRVIIEELGYVLWSNYQFAKQRIGSVYKSLLTEEAFFIPDRELAELAVTLFIAEKLLSFEDCWLLALRETGKVEKVLTFDIDLQKHLPK